MSVTSQKTNQRTYGSSTQITNPPTQLPCPWKGSGVKPASPAAPPVTSALGVGEGEEQRGGHTDGFLPTAAHAAVLHLTAEQLPDNRVPRGPKGAGKGRKRSTWVSRTPKTPAEQGQAVQQPTLWGPTYLCTQEWAQSRQRFKSHCRDGCRHARSHADPLPVGQMGPLGARPSPDPLLCALPSGRGVTCCPPPDMPAVPPAPGSPGAAG